VWFESSLEEWRILWAGDLNATGHVEKGKDLEENMGFFALYMHCVRISFLPFLPFPYPIR
jgi:hypothetical protein